MPTSSNKIYRSTNSGVSWTNVFSTSTEDWVCIASDGVDHFYAGTFTSNYVSANNGSSWQSFGPGIPSGEGAFTIAVKDSNVFAGNQSGIYFSHNKAASFTAENPGFDSEPNNSVQGLAISSNYVFAGLFLNAVWKRPLSDFGISKEAMASAEQEISVNIFPDPVKDESVLSVEANAASRVQILIYDEYRRVVKQLQSANLESGIYQQKIDSRDLDAGDYFASVWVEGKNTLVKFVVVK